MLGQLVSPPWELPPFQSPDLSAIWHLSLKSQDHHIWGRPQWLASLTPSPSPHKRGNWGPKRCHGLQWQEFVGFLSFTNWFLTHILICSPNFNSQKLSNAKTSFSEANLGLIFINSLATIMQWKFFPGRKRVLARISGCLPAPAVCLWTSWVTSLVSLHNQMWRLSYHSVFPNAIL